MTVTVIAGMDGMNEVAVGGRRAQRSTFGEPQVFDWGERGKVTRQFFEAFEKALEGGAYPLENPTIDPSIRRTQTARTMTDVDLLWISEGELVQVCYQNPGIAFYFLRLTTNRLLANASRTMTKSEASLSVTPVSAV